MCRVIADLLNPAGNHDKGDLYLKLFWDIVLPRMKLKDAPKLDTRKARVTTEYCIDAQRRIDIVINAGTLFIPIEVKINAREQEDQIKDYAAYAREKNKDVNIPVLYLTLEGDESETAGNEEYVSISFSNDILNWLSRCLTEEETEKTPPVREVIKQLGEAIKSILGQSEEDKMKKAELIEQITQSEENFLSALEIENALKEIREDAAWDIFKSVIFEKVKERLPAASIYDTGGWWAIAIPIKNSAYTFVVNYDWKSFMVEENEKSLSPAAEKSISKIMTQFGVSDAKTGGTWLAADIVKYPGMENVEENLYSYLLYKKYRQTPDEAANYIITMAGELEKR